MDLESEEDTRPFGELFSVTDDKNGCRLSWPKKHVSPFDINPILHAGDAFLRAAKENTRIQSVTLDLPYPFPNYFGNGIIGRKHSEIYYDLMELLAQGLGSLRGLKKIIVRASGDNHLDSPLFKRMLTKTQQIETLEFECQYDWYLCNIAHTMKNRLPNLKNLVVRQRDSLGNMFPDPEIKSKMISSIHYLNSEGHTLYDASFSFLGRSSLTELTLERCYLAEYQCQSMAKYLGDKTSNLQSLKILKIYVKWEGAALILGALKHHKKIKKLQIGPAMLKDGGCEILGELLAVNQSMETLILEDLDWKMIGDSKPAIDPSMLLPLFSKAKTALASLSIDGVGFWTEHLTERFGAWLALDTVSVKELHLIGPLAGYSPLSCMWRGMVRALAGNNGLQKLNLDFDIDQQQAFAMASSLQKNTCLEKLCLSCGAQVYATAFHTHTVFLQALDKNNTLKSLHIQRDWNPGYANAKLLEKHVMTVSQNYGISELVGGPPLSWLDGGPCLHYNAMRSNILRMNGAGRKYVLTDPTNKAAGVKVLHAVINNLDGIYFHLFENPALFCHASPVRQLQNKGKRASETQDQPSKQKRQRGREE